METYVQICFKLKKNVNNQLLKGLLGNFQDKTKKFEKNQIILFVKVECNDFVNHIYNDIRFEHKAVLKEITIEKTDKNANDKFESMPLKEMFAFVNEFLGIFENSNLEVLITDAILSNLECGLKEEELIKYNIDERFYALKRLVSKGMITSKEDSFNLFRTIEATDKIVLKLIFYLLIKNIGLDIEDILEKYEEKYTEAKGKKPEIIDRETLLTEDNHKIAILEAFFKEYILLDSTIQKVKEQLGTVKSEKRIELPLEFKAYNLSKYGAEMYEFFAKFFDEDLELILESFKRVLKCEFKRIEKKDLEKIKICFLCRDLDDILTQKGILYHNKEKMINDKINTAELINNKGILKPFVVFKGYIQKRKLPTSYITDEARFIIRDDENQDIECRINENEYNLEELEREKEVRIQAIFNFKATYNEKTERWSKSEMFFDIIDIETLGNFKPISIVLQEQMNGVYKLENNRKGLWIYIEPPKGVRDYSQQFLSEPIVLNGWYEGKNEIFYDIEIGDKQVCKPIDQIRTFIEKKTNYCYKKGPILEEHFTNLFRELIKRDNLPKKSMYPTVGVFLDEQNELVVVTPQEKNLKVIGENAFQKEVVDLIESRGLDENESSVKEYYGIIHLKNTPEDVRLGISGYSAIGPFFYSMRNVLSVFPNIFIFGPPSSGKTDFVKLMINELYGTVMKDNENIESTARLTEFETESTIPLHVDEIASLDEDKKNHIKGKATTKTPRVRMKPDQTKVTEETYPSFIGSSNNKEWILKSEDDAFRTRCLIFEYDKRIIDSETENPIEKFTRYEQKIRNGKILGFNLLKKSLEYIDKEVKSDGSVYEKFKALITDRTNALRLALKEKKIEVLDIRRYHIYALIYIGVEFWNYMFKCHDLQSELLTNFLDLQKNTFCEFVKKAEDEERKIRLGCFDNILQFYELNNPKKQYDVKRNKVDIVVLQVNFINDYDEWARKRGYEILQSVSNLAKIEAQILDKAIKADRIYIKDMNTGSGSTEWGVPFYYDEIHKLRHGAKSNEGEIEIVGSNFFKDRIFEICENNEFKWLERKNIIQELSADNDDEEAINKEIDKLIKREELESKNNLVKWKE